MAEVGGGIAFDLSKTNTGVVVFSHDGHPVSTWQKSYSRHRYFGFVLNEFRRDVFRLLGTHEPEWAAYEEVMPINKLHAEIHFGMVGHLATICATRSIPLFGVNTGAMKKHSLGHGRATKGEAVEFAQREYPNLDIPSHDVADALLVGLWLTSRMERVED